jgi:hypothetical protein
MTFTFLRAAAKSFARPIPPPSGKSQFAAPDVFLIAGQSDHAFGSSAIA